MDPVANADMQSAWASRRKTFILSGIVFLLTGISFIVFWNFWYEKPNCFDNQKNGDEQGIDCGGSCTLVCSDTVIQPIVRWDPRLFEVMPNVWSAVVYVENANTNADADYVPYSLTIYGDNNQILAQRQGATILPKNRTVGIFEGNMELKAGEKPRRTIFEIGKDIVWRRNNEQPVRLTISHSSLLRLDSEPRVEAKVRNSDAKEVKNIELIITVFDGSDNVIAASRTFIESLKKNQEENIFFTWPKPFKLGTKACERPSDIMLLLDRSGSMASAQSEPPEPLTQVKAAAASFVGELKARDQVGVISFATEASVPIDLPLSSDFQSAAGAINDVNIESGSTQYTNIYSALHAAWQELVSVRANEESSKIIVLLTDGVATHPQDPEGRTEADDIKHAEDSAAKEAADIKSNGLTVYTIGLGDQVNQGFLQGLASEADKYFFAPSALNLKSIYQDISSDICNEVPARIEITYKIFGDLI